MTESPPIACTLTRAELPARLAEMSALGRESLIDVDSPHERIRVLRFRHDEPTRERLTAIAAAEADCCGFLDLAVSEEGGTLALTIRAPAGAEGVLSAMVAAFRG